MFSRKEFTQIKLDSSHVNGTHQNSQTPKNFLKSPQKADKVKMNNRKNNNFIRKCRKLFIHFRKLKYKRNSDIYLAYQNYKTLELNIWNKILTIYKRKNRDVYFLKNQCCNNLR